MKRMFMQYGLKFLRGFNFWNYSDVNILNLGKEVAVQQQWQLWRHEVWGNVAPQNKFLSPGAGFCVESHLRPWAKRDLSVPPYQVTCSSAYPISCRNKQATSAFAGFPLIITPRHEIYRASFEFSLTLLKQVWRPGLSSHCLEGTNLATGLNTCWNVLYQ